MDAPPTQPPFSAPAPSKASSSTAIGGAIAARLQALGATPGDGALVHRATTTDPQHALDDAWDAIRAHALPPDRTGRLIVLIAPPPGDAARRGPRAGFENLARTLSIEWARHGTRPVAILPGAGHDRRRARRARRLPRLAAPAPTTAAARSPFARPRHLDGVLRRRVPRHDVLRRLRRRAVDDDVRLARRDVEHVAGLDRSACPRGGRPSGSRSSRRACRARSRSSSW